MPKSMTLNVRVGGEAQAERYICGLFERFTAIAERRFTWRPVPAEFGVVAMRAAVNGISSIGNCWRMATWAS